MKPPKRSFHIVLLSLCSCCACNAAPRITVIAHRGDSKVAPENTLSAFRSAIAAKANYVELDAQPSADGTLYCLHDSTLDRTTDAVKLFGRKKVPLKEISDQDLARLDAGRWFNEKYAGERLPTLAAALDTIQAQSKTLLERKAGTAQSYAKILREKNMIDKLIVQAFDWKFLEDLHKLQPTQTLGALGEKAMDDKKWTQLQASGAKLVGWQFKDLTADMVKEFHKRGYKVFAWTVDEPADWQRLIDWGVEGIITNRPGPLNKMLHKARLFKPVARQTKS
ncbi:MAG: glycerophosphodiester phosphodiesterase [Phycisphaerae bacterium]|nr:glycerophosphodiester phosphodiesterase [Phycisphaerae bacterium]